jgi:hypothetical protein
MFKRPIPRSRGTANGIASSNAKYPGLVSDIIEKMHRGPPRKPVERVWTPPVNYKLVATQMDYPEGYIKECEEWIATHPPKVWPGPPPTLQINTEPVIKVFEKYRPDIPPTSELVKAWKAAGYSEERIAKAKAHRDKMEATVVERAKVLDIIFAKFPSASKPAPKPKTKKVIKVVKKKMPQSTNEQTVG